MSWEALAWAKQQKGLGQSGKMLLFLLAEKAGSDYAAWPSITRLADEMECSDRTVQRHLERLESKGKIKRRFRRVGKRNLSTVYVLQMAGGDNVTPPDETGLEVVSSETPFDDNLDTPGDTAVSPTVVSPECHPNTSKNPTNCNTTENTNAREGALFTVTAVAVAQPGFGDFWSIYPRKISKAAAEKAWKSALKRSAPEDICAAAARYAAAVRDWVSSDRSFIKHPSTWLNQDCWLDEEMPVRGGRETKIERDVRSQNQTLDMLRMMEGTDPWEMTSTMASPTSRPRTSLPSSSRSLAGTSDPWT